ncbi:hypothetical protein E1B28_008024 [Marasmius oreades]|uniref:Uncharacterized protein n=1 Tax=Marasmius oreades TaxID=181124 RepID=A0A9P7S2W3_9AGAR|nr:uncharacterized protein E1B28_008024 [Marasmius oreades]KAG7094424.1 hypothetical protein E1B28_008024 [Marasmius oreades]
MPLPERLPGCKDLLSLCDKYPRPTFIRTEIPPISLPPPWTSIQLSDEKHHPRGATRIRIGRPETRESTRRNEIPKLSRTKTRKRRDTFDREEQRKAKLVNDPWSDKSRLTPKSVFCLGCMRNIKLDRRNDYYPGLWLKHRGLCHGIARAKARARRNSDITDSGASEVSVPLTHLKSEEISDSDDSDSSMERPMDDEQAARILIELMAAGRKRFDDS